MTGDGARVRISLSSPPRSRREQAGEHRGGDRISTAGDLAQMRDDVTHTAPQ
jgi:hypothetical protein